MSKPEKAIEFCTPSDLAGVSLEYAEDEAMKGVRQWPSSMRVHWILKIPPQTFDVANVLADVRNYSLQMEFTYNSDEWSFMALGFNEDGTDIRRVEVWSEGA